MVFSAPVDIIQLALTQEVIGALSVALDGLGSISVSGHYLDTNTLKESDATYNITVSVDNQRLVVPEMTEFNPIDHIDASRFTEIYGDCFISGFVEGGLFNANIHLKKKEDKKKKDIGGEGSASINVSGFDVKGSIKGGMTDDSYKKNFETTIRYAVFSRHRSLKKSTGTADWTCGSQRILVRWRGHQTRQDRGMGYQESFKSRNGLPRSCSCL